MATENQGLKSKVKTVAVATSDWLCSSDRDWREDTAHKNGNYYCECVTCKERFVGHKRRVVCKKCHDEHEAWWATLTPEQQAKHTAEKEEAIREWLSLPNTD